MIRENPVDQCRASLAAAARVSRMLPNGGPLADGIDKIMPDPNDRAIKQLLKHLGGLAYFPSDLVPHPAVTVEAELRQSIRDLQRL